MALTQKQLAELRASYLEKREQLLISKVDTLSVRLFDMVFEKYLKKLDQADGKLVYNDKNINLVKGLQKIYNTFLLDYNIPVIKGFVTDLQGITPLNEQYFKGLRKDGIKAVTKRVAGVVDKRLGVDANGKPVKNGFVDKFINDKTLVKKIQKQTTQAIVNKMGFQEFRQNLKTSIEGHPGQPMSGGLQQYYRNYAYDTFLKVDRLNQDLYASDLGLRYFIWSGGIINTSRPICIYCNNKIVDSEKFKELEYSDLKEKYTPGLDETWVPLDDLGQYGCRHRKDYILNSVAEQLSARWLDINSLTK